MWWGIEFVQDQTTKQPFPATLKPRLGDRIGRACIDQQHLSIMAFSGGIDGKNGDHVILAPPYNVTRDECDQIVDRFIKGVEAALATV